jgi:signal transduction histidine kinase/ActR/RegA family two-component response regulator
MVHDDGAIHFATGVRVDRAREPRLPVGLPTGALDAFSHVREVVAAGRIAIVTLDPEDMAASLVGSGGPVSALEQIGVGTAAMLPLIVDGRVRAVLSLVSTRAQRFTVDALVVEDVARRIQLALDRIQLYREAHEANRLKDDFLGTLSHELRTPLNAIFGWARILRSKELDPATTHAVEVIERNAEAQVRLIDEVLDVSRIIKGKMTFVMEPLDLAAILRATIDTVRPAMNAKRIRFEEHIDRLPPVVGDTHRLQQVFWNLLSNALKFTDCDGTISVRLTGSGSSVELAIADTGVGIRRDVLPFVFDRFRQADSSTTRTYGGLGLGLAIVKYIVELHGGTAHAASAGEGHGATFTIQLPVAEGTSAQPATLPADHVVPATLAGRTILVVEDHDDARELIVGILEGAGAQVLAASATTDAIGAATARQPDVLVADLGLPGEDGYVLLTRIRTMYPEMPALALTAYARATDRERVLAAGFQQHIVKPVDPAALLQAIVELRYDITPRDGRGQL